MTGTSFLNALGVDPKMYPKISSTLFILYCEKDRIDKRIDPQFVEPLFINNPDEHKRFLESLDKLEKNPLRVIRIRIDQFKVILFYMTENAETFLRFIPMEPIDYMN